MVNPENYQLSRPYLTYLREVGQLSPVSIDRYRFYLRHLLLWLGENPCTCAASVRPTFSDYLASGGGDEAARVAPATLKKIIETTRRLFSWAKMSYPRQFRDLPPAWIEALRPPRSSQADGEHVYVGLDEMLRLTGLTAPEYDLALRRDQAAAALLFASGMRIGALGSLPLVAVYGAGRTVQQRPSLGVRTKNSKSATTYLLNIPELLKVVERWDALVRDRLPPTAMWHTPIINTWGEQALSDISPGTNRNVAIIKRMRRLFDIAGLSYKSPHKFRHGHAVYALQQARTMADYKAVSMNLMHEDIQVTDSIYAPLLGDEVGQRIARLGSRADDDDLTRHLRSLSRAEQASTLCLLADELSK